MSTKIIAIKPSGIINSTSIFLLTISLLMLVRDIGGVGINKMVFVVLFLLCCLFGKKRDIYKNVAFITPLAVGLPYTYLITIALLLVVIKSNNTIRVKIGPFICICFIFLMEFLSFLRGYFSIVSYVSFVVIMLFSFGRMLDDDKEYDNAGIVSNYILGFFVAVADLIGQILTQFSFEQLIFMGRFLERFGNTNETLDIANQGMRLSYNPNSLGCVCIQVFAISLVLFRAKINPILHLFSIAIALMIGVMTQSRTFIITLLLVLLLYIILTGKELKTILRSAASLLLLVIFGYFAFTKLLYSYVEGIIARNSMADITNGRLELFNLYNEELFNHPDRLLFGVGLYCYPEKYGFEQCSHNAIQEVIIAWGIIGLVLIAILFYYIFYKVYKNVGRANILFFLPTIATFIMLQTGQGFRDGVSTLRLMVMYSFILMAYDQILNKRQENNSNEW